MASDTDQPKHNIGKCSKIYQTSFYLPFGIYNNSTSGPLGKNETFVGHEKERFSFIRHLHNAGKNSAYLVTGQRGVGKTSFVKHCLSEYENNVFRRYEKFKEELSNVDKFLAPLFFAVISASPYWLLISTTKLNYNYVEMILALPALLFATILLKNSLYCISSTKRLTIPESNHPPPTLGITNIKLWITWLNLGAVIAFFFIVFSAKIYQDQTIVLIRDFKLNQNPNPAIVSSFIIWVALAVLFSFILKLEREEIAKPCNELNKCEFAEDLKTIEVKKAKFSKELKNLSEETTEEIESGIAEKQKAIEKLKILTENTLKITKTYYKHLTKNSWLHIYLSLWMPSIKIHINLGFDDIGHKNIIFNLLKEVRQEYYEKFISWKSPIANLLRLFTATLCAIVLLVLFNGLTPVKSSITGFTVSSALIILSIIPALLLVARFIPIFPYRYNLRKIDFAMDRLTSELTNEVTVSNAKEMQLPFAYKHSKVYKPLSSRDIEYHFLNIISLIRTNKNSILGQLISLPKPEVNIIFDELDKIGGNKDNVGSVKDSLFTETLKVFDTVRSTKIKELLSDLKNIISSEHCRFIFIGGRHLNDEWSAEKTMRDQLLPSIFDEEIYLPSFLSDRKEYESSNHEEVLIFRTEHYMQQKLKQAQQAFQIQQDSDSKWHLVENTYNNFSYCKMFQPLEDKEFKLLYYFSEEENTKYDYSDAIKLDKFGLYPQFLKYLAYRSFGLPKRVEEILSSFVYPKVKALPQIEESTCEDILLLTDIDLCRIQFINKIYDLINYGLGRLLYNRDDKVVTSLFFLSDFIFKFHGRAFSWISLEKLDEIVDLHRSPDLRNMLTELIESYMGEFLRPILHGMFEFKFTSTMASEIKYLSRFSPTEAAAFNFTLDESHLLKEMHLRKLDAGKGTFEDCTSLAELYEYDQDYDNAIREYQRALQIIDSDLAKTTAEDKEDANSYLAIMNRLDSYEQEDTVSLSYIAHWAISRLRVMLRIGLVYEQRRDYERAGAWYHEAHVLSRRLLKASKYEEVTLDEPIYANFVSQRESPDTEINSTYFLMKHLHLLYQAVFAKAWLTEKDATGTDLSFVIVNTELFYLEQLLPFTLQRDRGIYREQAENGDTSHSTFGLIKSEMYKKAGDICFYKGAYLPDVREIESNKAGPLSKHGYLYRASYYYVSSLYYLREFNIHHLEASKVLYGLDHEGKRSSDNVFSPDQLTDYPLIEGASSLLQYAETLLARVDLKEIYLAITQPDHLIHYEDIEPSEYGYKCAFSNLEAFTTVAHCCFETWIKEDSHKTFKSRYTDLRKKYNAECDKRDELPKKPSAFSLLTECSSSEHFIKTYSDFIKMWFGEPSGERQANTNGLIVSSVGVSRCPIEKLICYTVLTNLAALFLKKAGHPLEASHEYRRNVEAILSVLESLLIIVESGSIREKLKSNKKPFLRGEKFIEYLVDRAVFFCEKSYAAHNEYWTNKSAHKGFSSRKNSIPSKLTIAVLKLNSLVIKYSTFEVDCRGNLLKYYGHTLRGRNIGWYKPYANPPKYSYIKILTEQKKYLDIANTHKDNLGRVNLLHDSWDIALRTNEILLNRCLKHRSTVMNRLSSLQYLLLNSFLFSSHISVRENVKRAHELLELIEQYTSNNHYIITQTAICCFLLAEKLPIRNSQEKAERDYIYSRAQELFFKNQQLYTMRAEYYKSIGDMYYLFDDFNDRSVHHGKAMQIMSSVLTWGMEQVIKERLS